jgi:hypothetical protein
VPSSITADGNAGKPAEAFGMSLSRTIHHPVDAIGEARCRDGNGMHRGTATSIIAIPLHLADGHAAIDVDTACATW